MQTDDYTSQQEEADRETLAKASEVTISRVLDGNERASKSRGEKWGITTKAGSLHLPPGPCTAAVTMLNPRFTPKKLPKPILNSVTFLATGHSSEEADLKTLAGASEVTVTKVPLGYVGHSSKKKSTPVDHHHRGRQELREAGKELGSCARNPNPSIYTPEVPNAKH